MTLGAFGQEEEVISNPLSPGVIKNIIYEKCHLQDEREAVVQQELVIHIGWIISNSPELFSGMLKIRIGSVNYLFCLLLELQGNIYTSTEIVTLQKKVIYNMMQQNGYASILHFWEACFKLSCQKWVHNRPCICQSAI